MPNKIAKLISQRGKLVLSKDNSLQLVIPASVVCGTFASINEPGTTPPDNVGRVEIMTPAEVSKVGPNNIDERGHEFNYKLGPLQDSDGSNGISKIYFQEVKSNELNKLRKTYGLPENLKGDKFKLIIAQRKTNVLRNNDVAKIESAPEVVDVDTLDHPVQIMRMRIFRVMKFGEDKHNPTITSEDFIKAAQNPNQMQGILGMLMQLVKSFLPFVPESTLERAQIDTNRRLMEQYVLASGADVDTQAAANLILGLISIFTDPEPFAEDAFKMAEQVKPFLPYIASLAPDVLDIATGGSQVVFNYHLAELGRGVGGLPPEAISNISSFIQTKYFGPDAVAENYNITRGQAGALLKYMAQSELIPVLYAAQNPEEALKIIDQNFSDFLGGYAAIKEQYPNESMGDLFAALETVNATRRPGDPTPLWQHVRHATAMEPIQQLLRGVLGSSAGLPSAADAREIQVDRLSRALNSRLAAQVGALIRAVDGGHVAPGSQADQLVQSLREHGYVNVPTVRNLTNTQIANILTNSGLSPRAASEFVSGFEANLDATRRTPGAIAFMLSAQQRELQEIYERFARYSDPVTARARLENYMARRGITNLEQYFPGHSKGEDPTAGAFSLANVYAKATPPADTQVPGIGSVIREVADYDKSWWDRAKGMLRMRDPSPTDATVPSVDPSAFNPAALPTLGNIKPGEDLKVAHCKYPTLKDLHFFRLSGG